MKNIVSLILLILLTYPVFAAETEGYYITQKGDTVRGRIQVPLLHKVMLGTSSQKIDDPLEYDVPDESKDIDYSKLTFDFKFSENEGKFKKIDRLKVKGFGFIYGGRHYNFVTWDVTANKQLYLIPASGDVAPDGVYFILRSINGTFPIYSLFQRIDVWKKKGQTMEEIRHNKPYEATIEKDRDGEATKRDIIFEHPVKGFIYISDKYPRLMKFPSVLKYLELEEEFVSTLNKQDNLLDVVKKYNKWKADN